MIIWYDNDDIIMMTIIWFNDNDDMIYADDVRIQRPTTFTLNCSFWTLHLFNTCRSQENDIYFTDDILKWIF